MFAVKTTKHPGGILNYDIYAYAYYFSLTIMVCTLSKVDIFILHFKTETQGDAIPFLRSHSK